jgi:hypothetical protein
VLSRLLGYIKGRDALVEGYLDNYQSELAGLPHADIERINICLKNFNFAAAHEALLAISTENGITLTNCDEEEQQL